MVARGFVLDIHVLMIWHCCHLGAGRRSGAVQAEIKYAQAIASAQTHLFEPPHWLRGAKVPGAGGAHAYAS